MKALLVAATIAIGTPSSADTITGNDILHACQDKDGTLLEGFCIGYIIGSWEGMHWGTFAAFYLSEAPGEAAAANKFANTALGACAPTDIENGQVKDIVVAYLTDHPEERHHSARRLIQQAMGAAYPCE